MAFFRVGGSKEGEWFMMWDGGKCGGISVIR